MPQSLSHAFDKTHDAQATHRTVWLLIASEIVCQGNKLLTEAPQLSYEYMQSNSTYSSEVSNV